MSSMKIAATMAVAILAASLGSQPALSAPSYNAVDLGALPGGNYTTPYSLNDSAQVVGVAATSSNGDYRFFLWDSENGMQDLGVPFGMTPGTWSQRIAIGNSGKIAYAAYVSPSQVHLYQRYGLGPSEDLGAIGDWNPNIPYRVQAINDSGQILASGGFGSGRAGWLPYSGILYDDASGLLLSAEWWNADTRQNLPQTLNDLGQAAGSSGEHGHHQGLFWKSDGTMLDIGALGGNDCSPLALNNAGQVVGASSIGAFSSYTHGFIWSEAEGMRDIGVLPGQVNSESYAINSGGTVIGRSGRYSFQWTPDAGMSQIGGYGDYVVSINDDGMVIGYSSFSGNNRAFVWSEKTGMIDLPVILGATNAKPIAINRSGCVLGYVYGSSESDSRAVLWQPIPEPASCLGDFNGDGEVDQADYTTWADHYGGADTPFASGSSNNDGVIDQADYTTWADNFGKYYSPTVPEPATLSLLVMGSLALLRRRN